MHVNYPYAWIEQVQKGEQGGDQRTCEMKIISNNVKPGTELECMLI